jgi:hypothetical protein
MYHAELAVKEEGPPGTMPVIRPRGIDLKDGPLFAALGAKTLGKQVGIPVCEGAATTKSPWNAPGKLLLHNSRFYTCIGSDKYVLTVSSMYHCRTF